MLRSQFAIWSSAMLVALAGMVAAMPEPSFARSQSVAAFFPPWWSQARVIRAAASAGSLLDVGQWSSVAVFAFSDAGLIHRLRDAGAILLVDAATIGCATPPTRSF
ncbi:hypothetical protein VQ042_25360 [Aurantimonas sp. A2-1-M11]|uniref:hypothetical protein n=1 Tax=Aurantimonas sp. A2-1-M11 TaxID=3113712 RepID=UPI002F94F398